MGHTTCTSVYTEATSSQQPMRVMSEQPQSWGQWVRVWRNPFYRWGALTSLRVIRSHATDSSPLGVVRVSGRKDFFPTFTRFLNWVFRNSLFWDHLRRLSRVVGGGFSWRALNCGVFVASAKLDCRWLDCTAFLQRLVGSENCALELRVWWFLPSVMATRGDQYGRWTL